MARKKKIKHFRSKSNATGKKVQKIIKRNIRRQNRLIQDTRHDLNRPNLKEVEEEFNDESVDDPMHMLLSTFSYENVTKVISSESEEEDNNSTKNVAVSLYEKEDLAELSCDSEDSIDDNLKVEQSKRYVKVDDPYTTHYSFDLSPSTITSLQTNSFNANEIVLNWPMLGDIRVNIPITPTTPTPMLVLEERKFADCGTVPERIQKTDLTALSVMFKIQKNIPKANNVSTGFCAKDDCFTELQKELFPLINGYQDLFYPERSLKNGEEVRFVYCLHTINHILKAQSLILRHDEQIKNNSFGDEYRDQGLMRPKVLILVPFRDSCYRITPTMSATFLTPAITKEYNLLKFQNDDCFNHMVVNIMSQILFGDRKGNVVNNSRFKEEFTGFELFLPKRNKKPEDFEALFAGNVDDNFKIGLSLTKKGLKLYTDFYSSDIIIASPLGLRMLIGAEGEQGRDYDFLASIEIMVLDQAEVFLMQNWDHVTHLFNHLHMQPRESHGTDFSRVHTWALDGAAKHYRQTLLFSSLVNPELNAIFSRHCLNYAGTARIHNKIDDGSISRVFVQLPHVYRRFECSSAVSAPDERFQSFVQDILPELIESSGVLIYVPSYFDFVRLRNHLKNHDYSFVQICEYAKDGKVARARDMFFHNEARMLLYSERFHFFRRINLKGIRHIIFYQPPTFNNFYSEMCNLMQEINQNKTSQDVNCSVTVLFCKYDIHQMSAIVKTSRALRIINSEKTVHMFTTG